MAGGDDVRASQNSCLLCHRNAFPTSHEEGLPVLVIWLTGID